jgi:hypothetical protein
LNETNASFIDGLLLQARCSEAELKEIRFFKRKESTVGPGDELSDIPEEESNIDLSHLGLR